jgi:hypothetical protein
MPLFPIYPGKAAFSLKYRLVLVKSNSDAGVLPAFF